MAHRLLKNLKKFIFEFVIVTLGIMAAFTINKWDENSKLKKEEQDSYRSLKQDLESELYVYNFYKEKLIRSNKYLAPILEKNYDQVDSLLFYLNIGFDLQERNATYVNLKFSGKLEILSNQEIKGRMILYYETYYQGLENMSNWNYDFRLNFLHPYTLKELKYNASKEDLLKNLKNDEFLNLIKAQKGLVEYNISTIEKSEALINKILSSINEELEIVE